jgi:dethiobiotin synthetase
VTAQRDGLLVTGTDTGVGKTVLSACLLASMGADGRSVTAHKPVVTGTDEAPGLWPADDELLAAMTGQSATAVTPVRFGPAVAPHLAARLAGRRLAFGDLVESATAALRRAHSGGGTCVVEGVGGLLSPLTDECTVCDLAVALGLPVVVVARPSLGTINHTLLTLAAARAAGLEVCAVVITPWPDAPSAMHNSNRDTIAALGDVAVEVLPEVGGPDRDALAAAGAALPWRRWLRQPPLHT